MSANKWNIDKPEDFEVFWENILIDQGGEPFANYTHGPLRSGSVDQDIINSKLPDGVMVVAPGCVYRGTAHPAGLTAAQERLLHPHPNLGAAEKTMIEKMRIEYLNNSVKTIHFFLARMEDHTRAFFMSLGEFRKAMEDKDLVKAAHVFRTKGQVGTGDMGDARLRLEQLIYSSDVSLHLSNAGENGFDFNLWCDAWKKIKNTLSRFGSGLTETDFCKGFINSLPAGCASVKVMMLAPNALPASLDAAIDQIRSMIVGMRAPLSNCRKALGITEHAGAGKKRSAPHDEPNPNENNKRRSSNDELVEMIVNAVTIAVKAEREAGSANNDSRGDGRGGTGRGGAGRGGIGRVGGRGGGRSIIDYNQECNNFKTKQMCSYQKEKGKMCQFVHSGPTTNVGGVIRPLIIKPQEGK